MKCRLRAAYAVLSCLLLAVEVCIALFVRDDFVRPYVGDMLVTLLLCCLVRVVFVHWPRLLPVWVFLFAAAVEVGQYFDFVALLGLDGSRFFSILLGRSFSWADIACYAVGCLLFLPIARGAAAWAERLSPEKA